MPHRRIVSHRFWLAGLLALGFAVCWMILASLLVFGVFRTPAERVGAEQLVIARDGQPLVQATGSTGIGQTWTVNYRTLEGEEVEENPTQRWLQGGYFYDPSLRTQPPLRGIPWQQRVAKFEVDGRPLTAWYFVHDGHPQGTGYFEGYDDARRTRVGFIGRNGLQQSRPEGSEAFAIRVSTMAFDTLATGKSQVWWNVDYWHRQEQDDKTYVLTTGEVTTVSLSQRAIMDVFETDGALGLGILQRPAIDDSGETDSHLAIRFPNRIEVLSTDSDEEFTYTLPPQLAATAFTFYLLADGNAVAQRLDYRAVMADAAYHNELFWFDQNGAVVRTQEVELQHRSGSSEISALDSLGPAFVAPITITAPAVLALGGIMSGEPNLYSALQKLDNPLLPSAVITLILGVVWTYLCYRRQKQFGLPRSYGWLTFVFLLGLPGYAGYILHRRWPPRINCPACEQPVPRDRAECCACQSPFAKPALTGIEVLA